jgi:hypothetical protein
MHKCKEYRSCRHSGDLDICYVCNQYPGTQIDRSMWSGLREGESICPICGKATKAKDSYLGYTNCASQEDGDLPNCRVYEFNHCQTPWHEQGIEQI